VVNRKSEDLDRGLDAHPVVIALDCVGGEQRGRHLEKMALGGRWILIATLAGEQAAVALRPLLRKGLRLIGSTLRSRSNERKGFILRELERIVWPAIAEGSIRPVIHATLPITKAAAAHALLERSENIGKVVLRVRD